MAALEVQKGFFVEADAGLIHYPVTNGTIVLQTTTANGRTAGRLYLWTGSAWEEYHAVVTA